MSAQKKSPHGQKRAVEYMVPILYGSSEYGAHVYREIENLIFVNINSAVKYARFPSQGNNVFWATILHRYHDLKSVISVDNIYRKRQVPALNNRIFCYFYLTFFFDETKEIFGIN